MKNGALVKGLRFPGTIARIAPLLVARGEVNEVLDGCGRVLRHEAGDDAARRGDECSRRGHGRTSS
jgi:hypothetical protein